MGRLTDAPRPVWPNDNDMADEQGAAMTETFNIALEQAEAYEQRFVPALFAQLAPWMIDQVDLRAGQSVLDVACGTGIVARTVAERIGPGGVTGVDRNQAMLTVAGRLRPDTHWRRGDVAALPFEDGTFDVVLCQSALMFFPDATAALAEMARVAASGGTVGVQVFARLDAQPAYGPWVGMVAEHAGAEARNLLGTYWIHGDLDTLAGRFATAGLTVTATLTKKAVLRFDSIEDFARTEIEATPLVERLNDDQYRTIVAESDGVLEEFVTDGGAAIPIVAHLMVGHKS
jgi:SAM-dependent methyltransferase